MSEQDRMIWRRLGGVMVYLGDSAVGASDDVMTLEERDGLMATWLHEHDAQVLLARPDHYVYGTAQTAEDLSPMIQALERAISPSAGVAP